MWVALVQEPVCGCHAQTSPPAPGMQGASRHPCPRTPKALALVRGGAINSGSVKAKSGAQMHCCFFICPLVNVPPFQPLPRDRETGERQPQGSNPAPGCWVSHSGQPHGWGDGTSWPRHIPTLLHLWALTRSPVGARHGNGEGAGNGHRK